MKLKVLIACEESQIECDAFRRYGHEAYSCDIVPCRRGGHPEWHILGDASGVMLSDVTFSTMDGVSHYVPRWDLVIAHPPCTYLCRVSSVHMWHDGRLDEDRYRLMVHARKFFFRCLYADAWFVAVENPIPMAMAQLPRPSCYAEPFWFGEPWSKKTLFWLRELPPLLPEIENPHRREFVRAHRGKYRSRAFRGMADAMARQWGDFICSEITKVKNSYPPI